ncbi:MAG: GNAT family N-acetyltransferase [Bacteroidales bacterium]|nr:GNAT family N-acetyltransferase [Candidatus Colimorpha onthohippi]
MPHFWGNKKTLNIKLRHIWQTASHYQKINFALDTSYIIAPVDKQLIKQELTRNIFLRKTNYGNKEIYVTTAHRSPNIMREIGRLRELSFALNGGGTGKECDIDIFDTLPDPYCFRQLIVWDPIEEVIVGGYRFIHGSNMMTREDGTIATPTADLFQYTDEFIHNYMPYTVELGRAFVQPDYQPSNNLRKGMYSLDNLWDGLGGIAIELPETKYFFGKITMYPQMNRKAKDLILYFYQKHFPDKDGLIWPFEAVRIQSDYNELVSLFNGRNYKEDYQILLRSVRALGSSVPPLINAYMHLSSTMRSFGTAINHHFGETDETGILITLRDIFPDKRSRYFESHNNRNKHLDREEMFHITLSHMPWWRKSDKNEQDELRHIKWLKRIRDNR